MATRSKRTSDEMRVELEVKSEAGSELEELNEEEYERERLENIKYVKSTRFLAYQGVASCLYFLARIELIAGTMQTS